MKIRIRKSVKSDVDGIYDCHQLCFNLGDQWYKSSIKDYVDNSYIVEIIETKKIIGVLLQGSFTPCCTSENFVPKTSTGIKFKNNNYHLESNMGILMLCVEPTYRNKGLAKKLIEQHLKQYKDNILCLNTRKSNPAYNLYLKMGYEHIGTIENKYYCPNEDSYFMLIKN